MSRANNDILIELWELSARTDYAVMTLSWRNSKLYVCAAYLAKPDAIANVKLANYKILLVGFCNWVKASKVAFYRFCDARTPFQNNIIYHHKILTP